MALIEAYLLKNNLDGLKKLF